MKWGAEEEKKMELQSQGLQPDTLFSDVIKRYLNEITPTKRGEKHEFNRLNRFCAIQLRINIYLMLVG